MLLLTNLRIIEVGVAKGVKVDLINSESKNDLIDLLTRIISSIKPSSDIDKIEVLLNFYNKAFC